MISKRARFLGQAPQALEAREVLTVSSKNPFELLSYTPARAVSLTFDLHLFIYFGLNGSAMPLLLVI